MSTFFRYEALRADGTREKGTIPARDRASAVQAVRDRKLFPVDVRESRNGAFTLRITSGELALGLRMLADLTASGLPVAVAVRIFEQVAPPRWRAALPLVSARLREGSGLAGALGSATIIVPPEVLAIIAAGERGDGLAAGLQRAAEIVEQSAQTRAAILGALAYPMILGVTGVASVWLLVGVVLPKFAALVSELGQTLPPSTRALMTAADASRRFAVPGLCAVAAMVLLWRKWTDDSEGKRRWHALLLLIPGYGPVRRARGVAQWCAAAGAMLETGVPLPIALEHSARAAGDAALGGNLLEARAQIISGVRVSRALADSKAATDTVVQMVRVGEESGQLARMLNESARLERETAVRATKAMVRLIEPGLILLFGGFVALVASALLQAVYSIRPGT